MLVDLEQRVVYRSQTRPPQDGDVIKEGWFDRAERLDEALDGEPITEETWGTSEAAQASAQAMMDMTGGPAPLRDPGVTTATE